MATAHPGTALITGGTAGLGREFAEQLAGRGNDLVLVARDQGRLETTADEVRRIHGVRVETISADLADRSALARVEARLADPDRPVELLVNNGGYGLKRPFLANSVDDEQAHLDVLVTAVMRLCHAAMGPMVERGHGSVVNVSSVSAFLPRGSYGAAKAWVTSFSEWAHFEYADRGVRVLALCPGFVRTEFHARMEVSRDTAPAYLWLDAPDVVRQGLADLDRGKAISVPTRRFQAVVTAARMAPGSLRSRFSTVGRR